MNTAAATFTAKFDALEARAAGYVCTPGPAGELQQRAKTLINNRMVTVCRRDGRVAFYEVESFDMTIAFCRTRAEAEAAVAA